MQFQHAFVEPLPPPVIADPVRCDHGGIGARREAAPTGLDAEPRAAGLGDGLPDRDQNAENFPAGKIKPRLLALARDAGEIAQPGQRVKRPAVERGEIDFFDLAIRQRGRHNGEIAGLCVHVTAQQIHGAERQQAERLAGVRELCQSVAEGAVAAADHNGVEAGARRVIEPPIHVVGLDQIGLDLVARGAERGIHDLARIVDGAGIQRAGLGIEQNQNPHKHLSAGWNVLLNA
jgi:hypothetical protein